MSNLDVRRIAEALMSNEYGAVTLGHLIDTLEMVDSEMIVVDGFGEPDSWRGVYAFLAFEPVEGAKVSDMLAFARKAVGSTYQGYKGGDFTMTRETPVFTAHYGKCDDDDAITPGRLMKMLDVEEIAEAKPSSMPKRPPILDYMVRHGGEWYQSIPREDWGRFKGYVSTLEGLAKRLHTLPAVLGQPGYVLIPDAEWFEFKYYVAGLEGVVAKNVC